MKNILATLLFLVTGFVFANPTEMVYNNGILESADLNLEETTSTVTECGSSYSDFLFEIDLKTDIKDLKARVTFPGIALGDITKSDVVVKVNGNELLPKPTVIIGTHNPGTDIDEKDFHYVEFDFNGVSFDNAQKIEVKYKVNMKCAIKRDDDVNTSNRFDISYTNAEGDPKKLFGNSGISYDIEPYALLTGTYDAGTFKTETNLGVEEINKIGYYNKSIAIKNSIGGAPIKSLEFLLSYNNNLGYFADARRNYIDIESIEIKSVSTKKTLTLENNDLNWFHGEGYKLIIEEDDFKTLGLSSGELDKDQILILDVKHLVKNNFTAYKNSTIQINHSISATCEGDACYPQDVYVDLKFKTPPPYDLEFTQNFTKTYICNPNNASIEIFIKNKGDGTHDFAILKNLSTMVPDDKYFKLENIYWLKAGGAPQDITDATKWNSVLDFEKIKYQDFPKKLEPGQSITLRYDYSISCSLLDFWTNPKTNVNSNPKLTTSLNTYSVSGGEKATYTTNRSGNYEEFDLGIGADIDGEFSVLENRSIIYNAKNIESNFAGDLFNGCEGSKYEAEFTLSNDLTIDLVKMTYDGKEVSGTSDPTEPYYEEVKGTTTTTLTFFNVGTKVYEIPYSYTCQNSWKKFHDLPEISAQLFFKCMGGDVCNDDCDRVAVRKKETLKLNVFCSADPENKCVVKVTSIDWNRIKPGIPIAPNKDPFTQKNKLISGERLSITVEGANTGNCSKITDKMKVSFTSDQELIDFKENNFVFKVNGTDVPITPADIKYENTDHTSHTITFPISASYKNILSNDNQWSVKMDFDTDYLIHSTIRAWSKHLNLKNFKFEPQKITSEGDVDCFDLSSTKDLNPIEVITNSWSKSQSDLINTSVSCFTDDITITASYGIRSYNHYPYEDREFLNMEEIVIFIEAIKHFDNIKVSYENKTSKNSDNWQFGVWPEDKYELKQDAAGEYSVTLSPITTLGPLYYANITKNPLDIIIELSSNVCVDPMYNQPLMKYESTFKDILTEKDESVEFDSYYHNPAYVNPIKAYTLTIKDGTQVNQRHGSENFVWNFTAKGSGTVDHAWLLIELPKTNKSEITFDELVDDNGKSYILQFFSEKDVKKAAVYLGNTIATSINKEINFQLTTSFNNCYPVKVDHKDEIKMKLFSTCGPEFENLTNTECSSKNKSTKDLDLRVDYEDVSLTTELNIVDKDGKLISNNPKPTDICDDFYFKYEVSKNEKGDFQELELENEFPLGVDLEKVTFTLFEGNSKLKQTSLTTFPPDATISFDLVKQILKSNNGQDQMTEDQRIDVLYHFKGTCGFDFGSDFKFKLNSYSFCNDYIGSNWKSKRIEFGGLDLNNLKAEIVTDNLDILNEEGSDKEIKASFTKESHADWDKFTSTGIAIAIPVGMEISGNILKFTTGSTSTSSPKTKVVKIKGNTYTLYEWSDVTWVNDELKLSYTIKDNSLLSKKLSKIPFYISVIGVTKAFECNGKKICDTEVTIHIQEFELNPTDVLPVNCAECITSLSPIPGQKYIVSSWVSETPSAGKESFDDVNLEITYDYVGVPPTIDAPIKIFPKGQIIDGWQRIEGEIDIPLNASKIHIAVVNKSSNAGIYLDDIRISPTDASFVTYVYDPITLRLVAELDEHNYATIYEYDEEGALIRVKKETERGIMTIQENRNNVIRK